MSILGRIFGSIWDHARHGPGYKAPKAAPAPSQPQATTTPQPAPAAPAAPAQTVDVEALLDSMNAQRAQRLNWRTSIVDLMKLTGMESSLAERKELAGELGYTGDTSDSAAMNVWLHAQVMQKIRDSNGRIPDLTD